MPFGKKKEPKSGVDDLIDEELGGAYKPPKPVEKKVESKPKFALKPNGFGLKRNSNQPDHTPSKDQYDPTMRAT